MPTHEVRLFGRVIQIENSSLARTRHKSDRVLSYGSRSLLSPGVKNNKLSVNNEHELMMSGQVLFLISDK